jgi:hypothetical protein
MTSYDIVSAGTTTASGVVVTLDWRRERRHNDVMELSQYIETLRRELKSAAAAGTDETRRVAEVLGGTLGPAVRLVIMDALSQAADEITASLRDTVVEIRLRGQEPHIVVTDTEPHAPAEPPPSTDPDADGDAVRITLRLPGPLKNSVEQAATSAGISVNSWLVRSVRHSLESPTPRRGGRTISGYAQA